MTKQNILVIHTYQIPEDQINWDADDPFENVDWDTTFDEVILPNSCLMRMSGIETSRDLEHVLELGLLERSKVRHNKCMDVTDSAKTKVTTISFGGTSEIIPDFSN